MIKCAQQSPRVCEDGSIRWYEGDTFSLEFSFTFLDEYDNEVPADPSDKLTICFTDMYTNILHTFETTGSNTLIFNIDEEVTKTFKRGKYNYCVRRVANNITTVMRFNKVVVE